MKKNRITGRNFLEKSTITAGMATVGALSVPKTSSARTSIQERLPREVWVATVSQMDMIAATSAEMVSKVLAILEKVVAYQPDIVCLPEVFANSNVKKKPGLFERKQLTEMVLEKFSSLARQYKCYIICAVNTFEDNKAYNSAVVLDRNGKNMGEYRKIHLTEGEINAGLTPGPLTPPVFQTDFGKVGMQICFDIEWNDGWTSLGEQGAEIVFWPSVFAGGEMINTKAWQHKYIVVSSTRKNTSKVCDISGEVIAQTGIWDKNFFCAPVNLEKVFLHTWPFVNRFDEIRKKYGRKVRITKFHEEEWTIIESLSPNVFVADIMKEFGLKTHEQHIHDAEVAQIKARKG